jgi:hypothetical protein
MFRWTSRARPARAPRRVRPVLETLEGRDCPSVGMQPNDQLWYALNSSPPPPTINVPVMTPHTNLGGGGYDPPMITLNVSYNGQTSVTLSGLVTDTSCSAAGLVVTITGEVNVTTVTNSSGYFSVTTNAAGLGTVSATTVDSLGQTSNTATNAVTSQAPVISNFSWVSSYNNTYTFTATVTDASAPGLTVTFGGIPSLANKTATVQSNGTVSLSVQLNNNGSDNGTATAQTTNWWGQLSNVAQTAVWVSG